MRLAALCLALALAGCDSAEDLPIRLAPGTQTTYRYTLTQQRNGVPDETLAAFDVVQDVRADGQTVAGETGLTHVVVQDGVPGSGTHVWYRVSQDRLDEVAYRVGTGPSAPLRTGALDPTLPVPVSRLLAARRGAMPGGQDSTLVRQTPRRVLEYPLTEGRTWLHFEFGFAFRSTRTVLGARTVETPEGARDCQVVRTDLFFDGVRDEWIDWEECHDADGVVEALVTYRQPGDDGEPVAIREHRLRTRVQTPRR